MSRLPAPPRILALDEMPPVEGFTIPRELHVVCRSPALLGGMPWSSITPERLRALHAAGFRHIVRLIDDEWAHDPSPLNLAGRFDMEDLWHRTVPSDPDREFDLVCAAVQLVIDKLALAEGVVVHCVGGQGRTGTVIGSVLVSLGHQPDAVTRYLDFIHQRRGASWPEVPWQASVLHRFVGRRSQGGKAASTARASITSIPEQRLGPYRSTVFVMAKGGQAHRIAQDPDVAEFGIVTAFNPGRILPDEENEARHRLLVAEVERRGLRHGEMFGASPDESHREKSLLIPAGEQPLRELGAMFDQDAVFVVRGGEVEMVTCGDERQGEGLGRFEARVRLRESGAG